MKKALVFGAGRGPRTAVLECLKRSGVPLPVKDLARVLGMSYMGVKAHCIALEAGGYLQSRRAPSSRGRPRMLYFLTDSGEALFAGSGEELALSLLREAAGLFGPAAPQKLLVMHFRSRLELYRPLIKGESVIARARSLVRLREREGRMSMLSETGEWEIRESHNPLQPIMHEYPQTRALEENMVSELLGTSVRRREEEGTVVFSTRS